MSSSSIGLDWANNSEPDLSGYHVYRSTQSGFTPGPANRIASGVGVSQFTDNNLAPATTFFYRVTAVDTSGNESDPSAQTDATTQTAPAIQTLMPVADTYVLQNDSTVHGDENELLVKNASNTRQGYMKFDISSAPGPSTQALLRLRVVTSPSWGGRTTVEAREFTDSSWNESINWNSRPSDAAMGSSLGAIQAPVTSPTIWEIDVTDYLEAQRQAGQLLVSFTLRSTVRTNGGIEIDSRESSNPPELVLNSP